MKEKLYDVVAVSIETNKVRFMANNKTKANADAIENMAIMRRGCDEEFYATVPAGKFKDGDQWNNE